MAVEYILASKKEDSIGTIGLSISVFESIVKFCIKDMKNVELAPTTSFRKSVNCKVEDGQLNIEVNVVIKIGNNVNAISNQIQNNVALELQEMTSIKKVVVNVIVRGFYI